MSDLNLKRDEDFSPALEKAVSERKAWNNETDFIEGFCTGWIAYRNRRAPTPASEGVRDELVRSVHRASRRIWGLSAPARGMMMTRADDAERIMREEVLGETFTESPEPPKEEKP